MPRVTAQVIRVGIENLVERNMLVAVSDSVRIWNPARGIAGGSIISFLAGGLGL
jgi:hypothetical protein